jgi:hypothetical protein
MQFTTALVRLITVSALTFGLTSFCGNTLAQGNNPTQAIAVEFGNARYVHRWSRAGQHEFTPEGQEDLSRWRDMLTLNVHKSVSNAEQLAQLANQVLERYKTAGQVLTASSIPSTETRPAQHFIVALLRGPDVAEAVFARFALLDGRGVVIVSSHREYGQSAAPVIADWIKKNGTDGVNTVMKWTGLPGPQTLDQIPQSK